MIRSSGSMIGEATYFGMEMESESSVIARGLRRRDPELLDRLIEQYQHRLLRYLTYLCGDRGLAEDLFQETWTRVLERGHQYDGRRDFTGWLYSLAHNLTIDYLRKKNPLSLDALMSEEHHAPFEPADTRAIASETVTRQEQLQLIQNAMKTIPAEYREALVLRFQEDLPLNEIASISHTKLGTVKSRLYRGLSLLVAQLRGKS